jgi:hypothetical protein
VPPGRPGGAEVLHELLVAERGKAMVGKLSEDPDSIKSIKSTTFMDNEVCDDVYEVETGRLREVG